MKTLKNIFGVILGNATAIVSGVFVGFVLPKIISVSDYGMYKIFTLYFNYLGVLSLGIIDGIVLKYGGKNYDELDREKFRSVFAWYFIVNAIFTILIVIVALILGDADYRFVALLLAANLIPANITGYFQQISQITQRFTEYSVLKVIQSIANIFIVICLLLLYITEWASIGYRIYLVLLLSLNLMLVIWYLQTYKEITFGKKKSLISTLSEVIELVKIGFPLLLANLCTTLLLSIDRQFVSICFSTEEYATYAFAYSMLSLITVATSAISAVIYPIFKRANFNYLRKNYQIINMLLLIFVFLIILVYYPLFYFVDWFLPNYAESLNIFRIILPGLAVSASITVVMQNYYKVFDMSLLFFKNSVGVLLISFLLSVISYLLFGTKESISITSFIALLIWYVITERRINKFCTKSNKNIIYLLLMSSVFYVCTFIPLTWIGGMINLIVYIISTFAFFARDFIDAKKLLISK